MADEPKQNGNAKNGKPTTGTAGSVDAGASFPSPTLTEPDAAESAAALPEK